MRFSEYVGASLVAGAAVATPLTLAKRAPAVVPNVGAYSYIGCASEASQTNTNRTLTGPSQACNTNTVESCAAFCSGYSYFGVEFGTECYCGNTLMTGYSIASTNAACSFACAGNSAESCGGNWYMNLYGIPKASSASTSTIAIGSTSALAPAVSTSSAFLTSSSASAPVPTTSSAATTSSAVASTTTATTSSFTGAPTAVASAGNFNFLACAVEPFVNGVGGQRVLTGTSTVSSSMTVEYCASFCSGYTFFGVEYGQECYCGNAIQNGTTLDVGGNCNVACAANSMEQCGGAGRMNLYEVSSGPAQTLPTTYSVVATSTSSVAATSSLSSATTIAATTTSTLSLTTAAAATTTSAAATVVPSNLATVGSYVYGACVAEPFVNGVSGRTLTDSSTSNSSMTVELCASLCSGYTYFGVEYSSECYCGNSIGSGTTQDATNANCLYVCSGNAGEYCGGSGHMNLYKLNSAGALNLPVTLTASTTTASSTSAPASSTSTSAVAASTTSSSSSSSATSARATSTAAPTSSISSSFSSAVPTTTKASSSSSAAPTTTLTTMTSSTTSAAPAATTMPTSWSSTGSCQSISATTGLWPLTKTYNFSPYYKGSGYTCPKSGNLLGLLSLTNTYQFSGANTACQAAQQCVSSITSSFSLLSLVGMSQSFDLHYRTDTKLWECVTYSGVNYLTSLFNVANPAVAYGYGFSA